MVKNLERDEHVIDVFHDYKAGTWTWSEWVDIPYKTPKHWKKDPFFKKVDNYFDTLTNKRWLIVNYDTNSIVRYYPLSEYEVILGSQQIVVINFKDISYGTLYFMKNQEEHYAPFVRDHLAVFQKIKLLQGSLTGTQSQLVTPSEQHSIKGTLPSNYITQVTQNPLPTSVQQPSEDPLKVLKIRFAKGEITKEQFEDMKKMLE